MDFSFRLYTANEKTNRSLSVYQCGWEKCYPNHSFGPAVRDHYLIHYIVDGEGEYITNGKVYKLKKGDGFLITPSVLTTYSANPNNPWVYYWVGFHGTDAKKILERANIGSENPIFSYTKDDDLKNYMISLYEASNDKISGEYKMLGLLYLCLSCLVTNNGIDTKDSELYKNYLDSAIDYIQINYSKDMSVASLAKYIGINRSHLYRIFKAYLNISPMDYILNYRLEKAKFFLRETKIPVTDIAYSCGFNDVAHFSKIFKDYFKISPLAYRRNPFETNSVK